MKIKLYISVKKREEKMYQNVLFLKNYISDIE